MRIGYACLTVGINKLDSYKTCTIKKYSEENIRDIIDYNLNVLFSTLKYNVENNIKMFRISSDIIPLATHPINEFNWVDEFREKMKLIGEYIKANDIRVSMHPGQYTVLNSINEDVVNRAVLDLEYHCKFLDSLEVDATNKIILHIGGVYDNKLEAMRRFETKYFKLNENIKARLIIENDDKLYNIKEVLEISSNTGIPVVFDNLHHEINNSDLYTEVKWIEKCIETWKKKDGKCKIHYSNQNLDKRVGAHSDFIYINQFLEFCNRIMHLDVDIMLEVKDKNLSAIKCINCTSIQNKKVYEKEWARYKYVILERNHNIYKDIRKYLKTNDFNSKHFYLLIEKAMSTSNTDGGYLNGFDHVWGYFKKVCTDREKEMYKKKLEAFNNEELKAKSMKNFLYKMAIKYESKYLLDSYYFEF
ncbi:MAG: UV DNA damage repair endonuclease UvsE [Bacilli bacterium]